MLREPGTGAIGGAVIDDQDLTCRDLGKEGRQEGGEEIKSIASRDHDRDAGREGPVEHGARKIRTAGIVARRHAPSKLGQAGPDRDFRFGGPGETAKPFAGPAPFSQLLPDRAGGLAE